MMTMLTIAGADDDDHDIDDVDDVDDVDDDRNKNGGKWWLKSTKINVYQ